MCRIGNPEWGRQSLLDDDYSEEELSPLDDDYICEDDRDEDE